MSFCFCGIDDKNEILTLRNNAKRDQFDAIINLANSLDFYVGEDLKIAATIAIDYVYDSDHLRCSDIDYSSILQAMLICTGNINIAKKIPVLCGQALDR